MLLVIYVDVLFVINFFITYLLLLLTKRILKDNAPQARLVLGAFIGGAYSLVIIADELNILITVCGKILASALIVFAAFGRKRVTVFLKALLLFYFSNMLFLGIIAAIYMWAKPQGIALKNGNVYFDISAVMLLVCALFAYCASVAVIKIHNRITGKNEIYSLTVVKDGREYNFFAFADSGNKLREPFSDYPVIIVDRDKIKIKCERVIPYCTVGGDGMLEAFRPDKIIISSAGGKYETKDVYVALSKVESKEFSAILNTDLINI